MAWGLDTGLYYEEVKWAIHQKKTGQWEVP